MNYYAIDYAKMNEATLFVSSTKVFFSRNCFRQLRRFCTFKFIKLSIFFVKSNFCVIFLDLILWFFLKTKSKNNCQTFTLWIKWIVFLNLNISTASVTFRSGRKQFLKIKTSISNQIALFILHSFRLFSIRKM